jgi:predicted transcriptional regulator
LTYLSNQTFGRPVTSTCKKQDDLQQHEQCRRLQNTDVLEQMNGVMSKMRHVQEAVIVAEERMNEVPGDLLALEERVQGLEGDKTVDRAQEASVAAALLGNQFAALQEEVRGSLDGLEEKVADLQEQVLVRQPLCALRLERVTDGSLHHEQLWPRSSRLYL